MRKLIVVLTALVAFAVAGPAAAAVKTVVIKSSFSPKTVTVTEGDAVRWVNRDTVRHQVLSDNGQFVSPILQPGRSYTFTFTTAGRYGYKDELHPRTRGTVVVKTPPPTLTLAASASSVTFGDRVTLTGVVSSHRAGEQVAVYYRPYPEPNLIQRAVLLTTTGGAFSLVVSPQILTTYRATWSGAFSPPVGVQVQPRLTIGRNNGWILHAYGGRSFAGRGVALQRLNPLTGQWVTLRKVVLNTRSGARVVLRLPKGVNHLRVTMSVNQAGAGFLGAISAPITWRET
jgi:plastocyanin